MRLEKFLLLSFIIVLFSCEENITPTIDQNNLLIGIWSDGVYDQNKETTTYKRIASLPEEKYAIAFNEDNTFTERTSGWCGTPPLTFFNVDGSFSLQNDVISILVNSYPNSYALRIVNVSETELTVKRELTSQETDHQHLMKLFEEITTIANSKSCNNSNNWTYTAYGSKACGGPQGFIAYSTEIDVTTFLEKVAQYTKAEAAFNKKWGIASTCDLPAQPKSVVCENNVAVLKY